MGKDEGTNSLMVGMVWRKGWWKCFMDGCSIVKVRGQRVMNSSGIEFMALSL